MRGLQSGLQGFFSSLPPLDGQSWGAGASSASKARIPAGQGRRAEGRPGMGASLSTATFEEAWHVYCSTNPRLRDPRALPALLRRQAPPRRETRREVWTHCLGIDAAAAAALAPASAVAATADSSSGGAVSSDAAPETGVAEANALAATSCPNGGTKAQAAADTDTAAGTAVAAPAAAPAESAVAAPAVAAVAVVSPAASVPAIAASTAAAARLPGLPVTRDEDLSEGLSDLIEADVLRTFPSMAAFLEVDGAHRLRLVLRRLAFVDSELGYCQSLNFVAAVFIMVLHDEAMALLAVRQLLVKLGTRSWYTEGMRQLRADTAVLEDLVRERLPSLHEAFRAHNFELMFASSKWFLCLFATALEGEALYRVWDLMLCDGIEVVIRVAFVLVSRRAEMALRAKSIDDLILTFQEPQGVVNAEALVADAYNPALLGQLSRQELSQRRQQALRKVTDGDARAEMRNQHYWRGGVRPASVLNRG